MSSNVPWDVREHAPVGDATMLIAAVGHGIVSLEKHERITSCINRHAHLIGDLSFQDLYSTPLSERVPDAMSRLKTASARGLYEDTNRLSALLSDLVSELEKKPIAGVDAGKLTLTDIATRSPDAFTQDALRLMSEIKAAGIEIPMPTDNMQLRARRLAAIQGLLVVTPAATYKSLFTRAHRDTPVEARMAIQEAKASGVLTAKPPPPPPPPPAVTLANCTISFHTNNEDKDADTHVTVTVRDDNNVVAAFISNDFGHFDDNSDAGPFGLEVENPSDIGSLDRGTVTIRIDPNGHDTWRFNFNLFLLFSDGHRRSGNVNGLELTQNRRQQTFGLSGFMRDA